MGIAPFYQTVTTSNDYYMYDGFGVNTPSDVKGRLLLIGVYDLTQIRHFSSVVASSTKNYNLTFVDVGQNAKASAYGLFEMDGVEIKINDRVLLKNQDKAEENGIYIVTSLGSVNESFEIQRASDASSYNGLQAGTVVYCSGGNVNAKHLFQLMPYTQDSVFGKSELAFVDLTAEGFYSNTCYGLRLVDSICCSNITNKGSGKYEFVVPNFVNVNSPRLLKVLVAHNVDVDVVMQNLLTKNFSQMFANQANSNTSACTCI